MSNNITEGGVTDGSTPKSGFPFGGGATYGNIIRGGDLTADTVGALASALLLCEPGQTIFIPGDAHLDFTARIYLDQLCPLRVPAGVTIASDRGLEGSPGALLSCDCIDMDSIFQTEGSDVRLSGFRLRGPAVGSRYDEHWKRSRDGSVGFYELPTQRGIVCRHDCVLDNLQICGFSHAGVLVEEGTANVSCSSISDCVRNGLGYGVCVRSFAIIHRNIFGANRHSVACTGEIGSGYRCVENIFTDQAHSHTVDVHRDAESGSGGSSIDIRNNCFSHSETSHPCVRLRAIPSELCRIQYNWFQNYGSTENAVVVNSLVRLEDNKVGT